MKKLDVTKTLASFQQCQLRLPGGTLYTGIVTSLSPEVSKAINSSTHHQLRRWHELEHYHVGLCVWTHAQVPAVTGEMSGAAAPSSSACSSSRINKEGFIPF